MPFKINYIKNKIVFSPSKHDNLYKQRK